MGPEVSCPDWGSEEATPLVATGNSRSARLAAERRYASGQTRRATALLSLVSATALGFAGWASSLGLFWPRNPAVSASSQEGLEAVFGLSEAAAAASAASGPASEAAEMWEVVWPTGVNVRSEKSFSSQVLRVARKHDLVSGWHEGNWLRLASFGKSKGSSSRSGGYMAIRAMGTGVLLRRVDETEEAVSESASEQGHAAGNHTSTSAAPSSSTRTNINSNNNDNSDSSSASASTSNTSTTSTTSTNTSTTSTTTTSTTRESTTTTTAASCRAYGCLDFRPEHPCQCNSECRQHGSCCHDYKEVCEACNVVYNYSATGPAQCFCHLAGNAGCQGGACPCPQGCEGVTWSSGRTVTFKNLASATGCPNPTALLTIPKSYFADVQSLKTSCQKGMTPLLADLLRAGFEQYQRAVAPGPVKQCVHAAGATSQAWLHVHTICVAGSIDRMWNTTAQYWCGTLDSADAALAQAERASAWALNGTLSCRDVGCNSPSAVAPKRPGADGPACSCARDCNSAGRCCEDYDSVCRINVTSKV